jgi:hypothetical protein
MLLVHVLVLVLMLAVVTVESFANDKNGATRDHRQEWMTVRHVIDSCRLMCLVWKRGLHE